MQLVFSCEGYNFLTLDIDGVWNTANAYTEIQGSVNSWITDLDPNVSDEDIQEAKRLDAIDLVKIKITYIADLYNFVSRETELKHRMTDTFMLCVWAMLSDNIIYINDVRVGLLVESHTNTQYVDFTFNDLS